MLMRAVACVASRSTSSRWEALGEKMVPLA